MKRFLLLPLIMFPLMPAAGFPKRAAAAEEAAPPVVAGEVPGGAATEVEVPEVTFPEPREGEVTARLLNVRVGPSVDKEQISSVRQGQRLIVTGSKGKWLKIDLPSEVSVWMMSKYVTLPEGQPLPVVGTVNASQVRVRSGGDMKSPVLCNLDQNAQVEVLASSGEWFKIKAPAGTAGWVYATYVKMGPATAEVPVTGPGAEPVVPVDPGTTPVGPEGPVAGPNDAPPTPVGPGPETPPVPVEGPGVDVFAEAEAAYTAALAAADPDLAPVYMLYRKAALTEGVPASVKTTCEDRMRAIAGKMTAEQKKRVEDEVRRGIEEQVAAIRAAAEEAKNQLPKVAPKPTAVGFIDVAPNLPGIPGTHKLSESGVILYYLRSAADDVDLEHFVGHRVGVIGRKRFVGGWGVQVIDVSDVFDYKDAPSTSASFSPVD